MRRLASVGGIEGAESVVAVAENEIGLEVRLETVLSAASRDLIYVYCIVVVAANWSRDKPTFVAAAAMLLKWSSKWAM